MNGVIINADDFGMDDGVNHAILYLIDRGIVSATSVMVLAPGVRDAVRPLIASGASVGLHFDLTSAFQREARWPTNLGRLIVASHLHLLPRDIILEEASRQLELFETAFGQAP